MLKQLDGSRSGAMVPHTRARGAQGRGGSADAEFVSDVVKNEMDKLEHISVGMGGFVKARAGWVFRILFILSSSSYAYSYQTYRTCF